MSNPALLGDTTLWCYANGPSPGIHIPFRGLCDANGNTIRTSDAGVGDGTAFLGGAVTLLAMPSAAVATATGSIPFSTDGITYAAWDMTITSFTGGTSPTIQFWLERQGADTVWYQIATTSALNSATVVSCDISPGLNGVMSGPLSSTVQHNVFSHTARLRWAFGGSAQPTAVTFSASIIGR